MVSNTGGVQSTENRGRRRISNSLDLNHHILSTLLVSTHIVCERVICDALGSLGEKILCSKSTESTGLRDFSSELLKIYHHPNPPPTTWKNDREDFWRLIAVHPTHTISFVRWMQYGQNWIDIFPTAA